MSGTYQPTNPPTNLHLALQWHPSGNGNAELRVVSRQDTAQASNVIITNSSIGTVLSDGAQLGPFSRLRISDSNNINEYKTLYGNTEHEFINRFGVGGSYSFNANASTSTISVGTASGDFAIRQTKEYHSYSPGCGQIILATGAMSPIKNNLAQRIGYFDDRNGVFFEQSTDGVGLTLRSWNIRTFNGGSPVISASVAQDQWNIDRFDGTGPSGINGLDFSRAQIYVIDFQWLGVGRVRCGFDLDGVIMYAHEFLNANLINTTYMGQPSLPVRYEIRNTAGTSTPSDLMVICSAVQTEGGSEEQAWLQSVSTGNVGVTAGTVEQGVLAIRLKNTVGPSNKPNRITARMQRYSLFGTQTAAFRVLRLSNASLISGSPTWINVAAESGVEYAVNFSLAAGYANNSVCINSGFISTAQGSATGSNQSLITAKTSAMRQNYDSTDSEIVALVATRIGNQDSVIYASMDWIEVT